MILKRMPVVLMFFICAVLIVGDGYAAKPSRDHVLSLILARQLNKYHYTHKEINDDLSQAAFKLYLKRLDFEKQFLLQSDVKNLEKYKKKIDDEIMSGVFTSLETASSIMRQRIVDVRKIVIETLAKPLVYKKKDYFETDAEKRPYAKNKKALRKLWQRTIQYAVLNRYLTELQMDQDGVTKKEKEKTDAKAPVTKKKDSLKNSKKQKTKKKDTDSKSKKIKKQAAVKKSLKKYEQGLSKKKRAELKKKSRESVQKRYVGYLDRKLKDDHSDEIERYLNAFAAVFDPHTSYMSPTKKEDFDIDMRGSLEGIGALLREDGPYIKVVRIIPGSASWRQKELGAEDVILKVAQGDGDPVGIVDVRVRDAVKLIRGHKGTEVRLTVKKPDSQIKVIPIVRDTVQIASVFAKRALLQRYKSKERIGYIYLPKFYRDFKGVQNGKGRNCTADVRKHLDAFRKQKVDGVILDLRSNSGGALVDAKEMSGLFIKEGPIVQVKNSANAIKILKDVDESISFAGPLVIMINRFSASASEILAAAMQDYHRGVVIGSPSSHGKGTVQVLLDMDHELASKFSEYSPLGALKVTFQKFYRVTGGSTQFRGVGSDVLLPDQFDYIESGEKHLDHALKWDEVKSASFSLWPHARWTTKQLAKKSKIRVKKSVFFKKVTSNVAMLKKRRQHTRRNVNLQAIFKENERLKIDAKKIAADANQTFLSVLSKPITVKSKIKGAVPLASYWAGGPTVDPNEVTAWHDKLKKDAYLEEAMFVLADIRKANGRRKGALK